MSTVTVMRDGIPVQLPYEDVFPEVEPTPEPVAPLALQTVASARLEIVDGEVIGLDRAVGLEMAFMLDADTCWLFFSQPQQDTDYIVMPPDGATKYPDFVEVVKPNASTISIVVMKVQ